MAVVSRGCHAVIAIFCGVLSRGDSLLTHECNVVY